MVSRRNSPLRTCVLPSFQDFCEGLSPSAQESYSGFMNTPSHHVHEKSSTKSAPPTPTNSLVVLSSSYTCPYSHCGVDAQGFARWEDCISHMQDHHAELVNELLRSSMVRVAADAASDAAVKHSTYTPARSGREVSEQTIDGVSWPRPMGWFDPNTDHARAAFKFVKHLSIDELHRAFYEVDGSRPLYGDQPIQKKASSTKGPEANGHADLHHKQRQSKPTHKVNERSRRDRHSVLMSELHVRTPELAHLLGEEDQQLLDWKKAGTSKGPGKYDQMFSDLYMHNLSAIVVQSEHNARRAAERRVEQLEQQLHSLQQKFAVDEDSHYRQGSQSPSKRRRTFEVSERCSPNWTGKSLLLPPSPSPSVASPRQRWFKS